MPQSGYAPVNGLDLYYEVNGVGEPLVLLHGAFGTIDLMFGALIPELARTRQIIALELQGHGHTADIDRPMLREALADDVAALLDHLGIPRADVLGSSFGGSVAWRLAIQRPERVRKVIVMSTPARHDGWYPATVQALRALGPELLAQSPLHDAYVRVAPRPEDFARFVTNMAALAQEEYDWSAEIAALAAPTLIVVGDADGIRPEHVNELFASRGGGVSGDFGPMPASQLLIVPGASHWAVPSRVDILVPAITAFLDAPMPDAG